MFTVTTIILAPGYALPINGVMTCNPLYSMVGLKGNPRIENCYEHVGAKETLNRPLICVPAETVTTKENSDFMSQTGFAAALCPQRNVAWNVGVRSDYNSIPNSGASGDLSNLCVPVHCTPYNNMNGWNSNSYLPSGHQDITYTLPKVPTNYQSQPITYYVPQTPHLDNFMGNSIPSTGGVSCLPSLTNFGNQVEPNVVCYPVCPPGYAPRLVSNVGSSPQGGLDYCVPQVIC